MTWGAAKYITTHDNSKQEMLVFAILIHIGLLMYFKYTAFILENINGFFSTHYQIEVLFVPLGISFITFQHIAFLVDSYLGKVKMPSFCNYLHYSIFFPKLSSGPILFQKEMLPQFSDESRWKFNIGNMAEGVYLFAIGLGKKVLLADTLGKAVALGYSSLESLSSADAAIVMLAYTFELYFDFSGYCDMGMGIARMINIELPLNFNCPYRALSIEDFWKRWHISLTDFFREYVYFPLGGSRKGSGKTYLNILIVYFLSGIWHGASWTFIGWGCIHGFFMCLNRYGRKAWDRLPKGLQWFGTFFIVNIAWVFFRADNFSDAYVLISRIFCMTDGAVSESIKSCFIFPEIVYIASLFGGFDTDSFIYLFFIICFCIIRFEKSVPECFRFSTVSAVSCAILLVWSIISLAHVSVFIYDAF